MFKKVAFTVYPVKDVPRARAFYEETLGLTVGLVHEHDGQHWVEYDLPQGGCFALSSFPGQEPGNGGTIALEVEDLNEAISTFKGRGVRFVTELIRSPSCGMIVCADTEGNTLLLHQRDKA